MTVKPSAVDSAPAQGTTGSSFSSGAGNDLQQRCHTIESGLNDLRTVLKTLTTTCAILERSTEKLGSDMMEIRDILACNHSPWTGQDISERRTEGARSAVIRVNDVSVSKLDTPILRSSNTPVDTINAIAGPSGVRNTTRTSPSAKQPGAQPGAYITPVGRMSVSSVVPPTEAPLPTASWSAQPDTPARPVVPSSRGKTTVPLSATGHAQVKRKEDDLMNGVSTPVPLRTLPPRRARKQGLGIPKSVPSRESSSEIGARIIHARALKVDTPHTGRDLRDTNARNSSYETLVSTNIVQHNPPKQVHFDKEFVDPYAPISETRTHVEQLEAANAESLPEPAPRMELRIRIRNPTKNAPGRIENISGMRVRIPKAVIDKMPSSVASSIPLRVLVAPVSAPMSIPSSQASGPPKMAATSAPVPSSETALSSAVPKAKRPVGRPRKRRKTTSVSKKVKQEDIEASLTADGSLLQMDSDRMAGVQDPLNASIHTAPNAREEKPLFEFTSLTKALEKCKDAFSNYLVAASRESITPASSTSVPHSSKRVPAQKRLPSSSVPSTATFSPKIETQDFPMYPSASSVLAPPLASSSNAPNQTVTPTVPIAPLSAPPISPPFLVPSNAPPINPELPGASTAQTIPRSRRLRGARLAELDREAEERMRVSREKRDKTRWDPGSGRRVVVPAGTAVNGNQSGLAASAEWPVRSGASRGRDTGRGMPLSRGLTQGAGSGSKLKGTNMSPMRAGVIVKEEEEEEEW